MNIYIQTIGDFNAGNNPFDSVNNIYSTLYNYSLFKYDSCTHIHIIFMYDKYIYIYMWLTHVFYLLILHSSLSGHKWIFPLFARNEVFPPWPICPIQRHANSNLDPQNMGDWSSKSIDSIEINVIWYNLCVYIYMYLHMCMCIYRWGYIFFLFPYWEEYISTNSLRSFFGTFDW
jgi:hypothetical protein